MNTLTKTANGFDLSAFSGRELEELFEAIENELDKRQEEADKAKNQIMPKVQKETKTPGQKRKEAILIEKEAILKEREAIIKEKKAALDAIPETAKPHYENGHHQSAKIVSLAKINIEGMDVSDVDMDKVEKLANIYSRDNGNTIPMLIESTGYVDCQLHYNLIDVGQSKTIYLALMKARQMNKKVAAMAIIRQGQCYMMSNEANGLMDADVTNEYELLM